MPRAGPDKCHRALGVAQPEKPVRPDLNVIQQREPEGLTNGLERRLKDGLQGGQARHDLHQIGVDLQRQDALKLNDLVFKPPMQEVMRLCSPYLHEDLKGEATLSMGRAVEYARHGVSGIVNVTPFNCLPGTIVNALLWRFSQDYPHVPVLKMVYDGTTQSGDQTRIEAFMYQAQQAGEIQ